MQTGLVLRNLCKPSVVSELIYALLKWIFIPQSRICCAVFDWQTVNSMNQMHMSDK